MAETTSRKGFVRLAVITAVLVWTLIAVGGVVRVTESGLGCGDDWPLCEGSYVPAPRIDAVLEYLHRIVAALSSLFILLTAISAWRRFRGVRWIIIPATVSLVLLVGEVVLGAVTVFLELPPEIVVAHLAVAFTILASSIVAAVVARYPQSERQPRVPDNLSSLLWLTVPALFLLLLSGALVTGSGAAGVCPSFPLCAGQLIPSSDFPLQRIQMLHRLWMLILAVLVVLVIVQTNRGERPRIVLTWSWVLGVVFVAQVAVGVGQVLLGLPTALRAAHVALAAGVWGAMVALSAFAEMHRAPAASGAGDGG